MKNALENPTSTWGFLYVCENGAFRTELSTNMHRNALPPKY